MWKITWEDLYKTILFTIQNFYNSFFPSYEDLQTKQNEVNFSYFFQLAITYFCKFSTTEKITPTLATRPWAPVLDFDDNKP